MPTKYRFEILQGKDGRWFWHFVAPNNEICCVSQMYTTKGHAMAGAEVLVKHAANAEMVVLSDTHTPKPHNDKFLRQWHHDNTPKSRVQELLDLANFNEN